MKIGIDITSLIYQRGVSRYTANLVRALAKYSKHSLSLYGYSFSQKKFLKKEAQKLIGSRNSSHQIKIQPIPISIQEKLWKVGLNKVGNNIQNPSIFHSWDWLQPPDKNIPIVSTVHDLAILRFPESAHPRVLRAHQESWKRLKDNQSHLIAVSQATKKDLVELLDYPNWLIHVVAEALPTEFEDLDKQITEEELDRIKYQLKLDRPYILFVGVREPRKNLSRLIEAWQPFSNEVELIVVGEKGWDSSHKIDSKHLRFLGRVSDKQLSVLYAEAEAFAYPSLYEGFGLPILEAFHHGTPVITSDLSAMIEVSGNAAILVNPTSTEAIREGLNTILNENCLQQQQRLQRMIIRKQMFSWHKVAEQTIKVYQKAIDDFADRASNDLT